MTYYQEKCDNVIRQLSSDAARGLTAAQAAALKAQLGRYLGLVALAACAIIFVVGVANGIPVMEIFQSGHGQPARHRARHGSCRKRRDGSEAQA